MEMHGLLKHAGFDGFGMFEANMFASRCYQVLSRMTVRFSVKGHHLVSNSENLQELFGDYGFPYLAVFF